MTSKEYKKAYDKLEVIELGDYKYLYQCPICKKYVTINQDELQSAILSNKMPICNDCKNDEKNKYFSEIICKRRQSLCK